MKKSIRVVALLMLLEVPRLWTLEYSYETESRGNNNGASERTSYASREACESAGEEKYFRLFPSHRNVFSGWTHTEESSEILRRWSSSWTWSPVWGGGSGSARHKLTIRCAMKEVSS